MVGWGNGGRIDTLLTLWATQGDSIEVANVAILLHGTMKAVSGDEVESGACLCGCSCEA